MRVIDHFIADTKEIWAHKNMAEKFLVVSWLLIVGLIPFHALLSTWGGAAIGPLELWKSWKEIILLVCLLVSCGLLWRRRQLRSYFADPLTLLILIYAGVHLLLLALLSPDTKPALAGLLMNLRFLGMVLLAGTLLTFVDRGKLLRITLLAVFVGIVGVIGFGVLQLSILPHDFLRHFGYSAETIMPYVTLDSNESIIRAQSTLRGPNPLGAYLIIAGLCLVAIWHKTRLFAAGGLLAVVMLLFSTHSRSAWIGAAAAGGVWGWLTIKRPQLRRSLGIGVAVAGAIIIGFLWWAVPQSTALQNIVLHNKEGDTDAGSTAVHWQAVGESVQRIADHPLGRGPGAAGPASFYSPFPQVPENYYLQITEEVGVIGLALFVAISAMVFWRLWQQRHTKWAMVLLASFVGIGIVNLFLHGWADDTTAVIWWALAGVIVTHAWPPEGRLV